MFGRQGPGADFEELIALHDRECGLRGVIAIHSSALGPAFGGIRRRPYADEESALADALALAEAMTFKCALAGLSAGGAKTVIWSDLDIALDREAIYSAIGRAIERLGGRYIAGPDLGTGDPELDIVREYTSFVNPSPNDAAASTAAGVAAGMRAVFKRLGVRPGPQVRVAIQGLGAVGLSLAKSLLEQGVAVIGADPDSAAVDRAREHGIEVIDPARILFEPCDVLSPCAHGGVFEASMVARMRCRAVCGSANNQLVDKEAAQAMMRAGIVHAPDVLVSAGAVIEGVLTVSKQDRQGVADEVRRAIDNLESVTDEVLAEAEKWSLPPDTVARRRGRSIIRRTKEG